ncbi:MAG TPA: 4-hydroxy-tetrahydrodipicolinate reductase [Flavobacteriales bacterium]
MNIALYGYGKMGKAIEQVALARGHNVPLKVSFANAGTSPQGVDVAIEFSRPEEALSNIELCLKHGVPIVVGTTGWYDQLSTVQALVKAHSGSLLWASNFSIGVNLFFRLNKYLAGLMDAQPGYTAHMDEIHHIHKRDAPSGTAITLARDIDLKHHGYSGWELKEELPVGRSQAAVGPILRQAQDDNVPIAPAPLPIHSQRIGEVPGTHGITWTSAEDRITITHEAFGRQGFATGAVVAAEWLRGRNGLYTMDDVLSHSPA